jgi:hypothetical protein
LIGVLEADNRLRTGRLGEELARRGKRPGDLPDYRELMLRVGNNSAIRVRELRYSVSADG